MVMFLFVMFYSMNGDTYTYYLAYIPPLYFMAADFIIYCSFFDFSIVVISDAMNCVLTLIFSYFSYSTSEFVKNIFVTLCFSPITFK